VKAKPVVVRAQASQDIEAAVDHYLNENAANAAMGFIDALEFLVFYVEAADHIDVWRVLHTSRDLPERMRELRED
jgi:toxin ParE1/3/4